MQSGTYFTVKKDPVRLPLCKKLCLFCLTCCHSVSLSGEKHCFQCALKGAKTHKQHW